MKYEHLNETIVLKTVREDNKSGVFEIEGLYTGYGVTIGNALRRVLLSSLPGAAITQVKIKGASHEFTTLPGITEDMVELTLNLKRIRFIIHTAEPQTLVLKAKGESEITARDIKTNAQVEVITPDEHIATLNDKSAEFEMELTVEKGLGYVPAEARRTEKLPIGVIALDALFSPVTNVNFSIENMRVGDRTDYNRIKLFIETDGSLTPSQALRKAARILEDHFSKVSSIEVTEIKQEEIKAGASEAKKKTVKSAKKK